MTRSRRIVFELDAVRDTDVNVLRAQGADAVVVTGNRVELELPPGGPSKADLVAVLVAGGARVNGVSTAEESLEDAYLSILGDQP